ncbi:MAG: 30S ribosomal protein S1 [Candidatus Staskawiczbacteria bacterium CG10_big_fil_rev_8_21_14_0_10_38_10]|uniref:30S ribosomal protein S1 n=1 Tax=Candidatus Staskawiczbacteria bacterium CG10_big_fil_rev_8_21_14_0_10_38_10 TaxID=1974891 RepID=A0A2H9T1H3_9BACT|nr:MAG: 30S ribosomal protein S1 [Candidatus Staskawiczbacteria bacterium CG10_big_fil_rev_8_21_14_0_10_38_10]
MIKNIKKTKDIVTPPSIGSLIEGKIVARGRSSVFVDLSPCGTGIIYGQEFYDAKEVLKNLKIGDKVSAKITELDNEEGYKELSLMDATKEFTWEKIREKKEKGEILEVQILGANKGGLLGNVEGVPAFLPVSQLSPEHYPRIENGDKQKILEELQKFVGKPLQVKVIDLDPRENKLILSEKAKEEEKIKEILKEYKAEDIVDGEISGVADFGAFIKFGKGNLEGLIHISELDWQLIGDPSEVVKVGQKVKAQIININKNNQVFLSLKRLKKDPWTEVGDKFKKGDVARGKVVKFNPYGAFVQLTPEICGLSHISEFGTKIKMEESLKIGESYDFKISSIDSVEHRISLKLASK